MSDRNSLWTVQSTGTTHYLAGSLHVLKEEDYPLNEAFENAFNSTEVIVVESDPYNTPPEEMERIAKTYCRYSGGGSLQASVSKATFELVRSKAEEHSLDMKELDQLKPWVIEITFTGLAFPQIGLDHEHGLDKYFIEKANALGKTVDTLESVEDQYKNYDSVPLKAKERDLLKTLSFPKKVIAKLQEIHRSWLFGDVEGMEALLLDYSQSLPEEYEILITKRNQNWLPRIESYLQSDISHMILVGTSHLVGERGILQAIQHNGYIIEQL